MFRLALSLFCIVSWIGSRGYSQVIEVLDTEEISIPKKLFTWVSFKRINSKLDGLESGQGALQPIRSDYKIVLSNPKLADVPALFTWIDPVGGVASSAEEIYGRGEVVMQLEIDPKKVKSAYLIQALDGQVTRDVDINKAIKSDIVFFQAYRMTEQGELLVYYQEWVILNQNIIKNYTIDPNVLIPQIKKRLSLMGRVNKQGEPIEYPLVQVHNLRSDLPNTEYGKKFINRLMEKYITVHAPKISELISSRSSNSILCRKIFSHN